MKQVIGVITYHNANKHVFKLLGASTTRFSSAHEAACTASTTGRTGGRDVKAGDPSEAPFFLFLGFSVVGKSTFLSDR